MSDTLTPHPPETETAVRVRRSSAYGEAGRLNVGRDVFPGTPRQSCGMTRRRVRAGLYVYLTGRGAYAVHRTQPRESGDRVTWWVTEPGRYCATGPGCRTLRAAQDRVRELSGSA